ncbi:MAG: DUF1015 domain-containing protein [Trebonia sp.]|jgi:uncharacterized protein (DUF1015 family)
MPFRGVRYAPARVGELANVTSPPYDVIGPGTLEQLRAASPYNIVRLILPEPERDPAGGSSGIPRGDARAVGQLAAARLRDWLDDGVLAVDPAPALYVYEQRGPGQLQRGLIGLVQLGTDAIHPHEDVMPGPVAGRRELMAAVRGNLEPILLVYNGAAGAGGHGGTAGTGHAAFRAGADVSGASGADATPGALDTPGASVSTTSRLVDFTAQQRTPLACTVTDDGVTHRLWALNDPAEHAAIAADLAERTALIADGHHRYAAYGELRTSMRGAGRDEGPWDYGLAFLVDADEYPLRLGPIHRVIPHLNPTEAARLAARAFTVTELAGTGPGLGTADAVDTHGRPRVPGTGSPAGGGDQCVDRQQLADALRRLAEAGRDGTAFLLAGRDGYRLLSRPDLDELADAMPSGASPRWRALDASVMQELLLARLWSIKDNDRDVLISHDAEEAVRLAIETGGTAVLCNPMRLAAVTDLAAHGERVPRKSTSFGPKPRTGLVLRTFDD